MKHRILIVDDAPDIRQLLEDLLQSRGYEVRLAQRGDEALRIAQAERPDAILLDIMMPGRDGLSTLKDLKADPKTQAIPVVMVSVLQQAKEVGMASSLGAAGYITKPFTPERVIAKVEEALARRAD